MVRVNMRHFWDEKSSKLDTMRGKGVYENDMCQDKVMHIMLQELPLGKYLNNGWTVASYKISEDDLIVLLEKENYEMPRQAPHSLGIADSTDKHLVASHETGHLLMLWLMDCDVFACGATEGGGVTRQLESPEAPRENPYEHILYALAGLVAEKNWQLLGELRDNISHPERFDSRSDSYHAALAISYIKGDPVFQLDGYAETLRLLMNRFSRVLTEITRLLLERQIINFDVIHVLFRKWDEAYFTDGRPKSDLVGRTAGRVFGWHFARGVMLGWDLKPLPEG